MFKFGGWKATLSFSGPSQRKEVYENGPVLSVGGAYRVHGEDTFGRNSISELPKKLTPSMVKLPPSKEKLKTSKSAVELADPQNLPPQLRKSAIDVSTDPRGGTSSDRNSTALHKNKQKPASYKNQEKEQNNADKKRTAEQKKQEKIAAQEQAKQDKLRIKQEKKIAEQQAKDAKSKKEKEGKRKAPQPLPQATLAKTLAPKAPIPPPQPPPRTNPIAYSSNTLESSISRSSGPPPYTETKPPEKRPNKNDDTGNTSFSKPTESSSWDMISEHRSQMNRNPVASGSRGKQVVMDLQFSFDKAETSDRNNSEV